MEEYLRRTLQEALNNWPGETGPTFLGDWVVILEGHTAEGVHLRIIDPDLTFWRRLGLVGFVYQQVTAEMAGNVAYNTASAVHNGEYDEPDDPEDGAAV